MIFHSTFKRPILLVGSGARSANAAGLIRKFALKTDIPVLTTMNAVDLAQDELHFGFIGTYGNRIANMMISECDGLISVGARLGLRQVGNCPERFAPKAYLIRADIDQSELSRTVKENEEKHLIDAECFMRQLLDENISRYTEWKNKCLLAKELLEPYDNEVGNEAVAKISSILPENPIVTVDVGQNQCWCAQSMLLKGTDGRILIGGSYGSMGCGLPYAIGASIGNGKNIVYCITGDGGLQMNIQELETIHREKLPIKIIVLNNHALGKISEIQHVAYGDRYAQTTEESGYTAPDFEKVACAYGIRACTLSSYESIGNYADWLHDESACLLNVQLPSDTLLIPKIKWETGVIEPGLPNNVYAKVKSLLEGDSGFLG